MATEMDMAGSVQPIFSDTDACQRLAGIAQPLLDSTSPLTLVMLVAEVPDGATRECLHSAKQGMDKIERLLALCLRRADVILRFNEQSCAALLSTETEGALCALDRFCTRLGSVSEWALALQVGLACAPAEARALPELLLLALKPRIRICSAGGGQWSILLALPETRQAMPLELSASEKDDHLPPEALLVDFSRRQETRVLAEPGILRAEASRLVKAGGAAQRAEMFARARARALGVPYLAPPQHIPSSVRNLVPLEVMRQLHCLPIGRDRSTLTVALADPTDRGTLHQLEEITGLAIFPVMTDPDVLEALAHPARPRRTAQMAAATVSGSRSRAYK